MSKGKPCQCPAKAGAQSSGILTEQRICITLSLRKGVTATRQENIEAMRTPHFVTLAEIDQERFISACRHGVVHLTWRRATVRLHQDELKKLASLLQQASDSPPSITSSSGRLSVIFRQDEDSELQIHTLILLLSPSEFRELTSASREAADRLEKVLASGAWDEPEEPEAPPDPLQRLRHVSFSKN
jgi:hypothetical protein